jgi:hypothetical protein
MPSTVRARDASRLSFGSDDARRNGRVPGTVRELRVRAPIRDDRRQLRSISGFPNAGASRVFLAVGAQVAVAVQRWGGSIEEIRPGGVVLIAPGERHWHGAAQLGDLGPKRRTGPRSIAGIIRLS